MQATAIVLMLLILGVMTVGGLAMYLKLKPLWARIAGMFSFGIGLLFLCTSSMWIRVVAGALP